MPLLLNLQDAFSFCSANIHEMDADHLRNAYKPWGFYLFIQVLFIQEIITPLKGKFLIDHNHVCAVLLQQGGRPGSGTCIWGIYKFFLDFIWALGHIAFWSFIWRERIRKMQNPSFHITSHLDGRRHHPTLTIIFREGNVA